MWVLGFELRSFFMFARHTLYKLSYFSVPQFCISLTPAPFKFLCVQTCTFYSWWFIYFWHTPVIQQEQNNYHSRDRKPALHSWCIQNKSKIFDKYFQLQNLYWTKLIRNGNGKPFFEKPWWIQNSERWMVSFVLVLCADLEKWPEGHSIVHHI